MICKSEHSDIQIYPMSGSELRRESEDDWRSYVNRGMGYVAVSLAVVWDFVGMHEMTVAVMEKAAWLRERI